MLSSVLSDTFKLLSSSSVPMRACARACALLARACVRAYDDADDDDDEIILGIIDPIHAAAMMNKKRGLAGRFTANVRVIT